MLFLFYFVMMVKSIYITFYACIFFGLICTAQTDAIPYAKNTTKANRIKEYRALIGSINTNLLLPLTDTTEADWQDAFYAMELINYQSPFTDNKLKAAFIAIEKRSTDFQRAAIELIYTLKDKAHKSAVHNLMLQTGNSKVFAMCAEYLLLFNNSSLLNVELNTLINKKISTLKEANNYAILYSLSRRLGNRIPGIILPALHVAQLLAANYLKGNVVVYSIQRKNRNYPGIAIVKDINGNFITDNSGNIFTIPQLARSISNLPGYLTNGNTPQGIFRMFGFEVSKGSFIGPTENIQLTMPVETTVRHFLKDSVTADTIWTPELYKKLLPESLKNYQPLYESFQAGVAGRTEIIAHGTTVNPQYYTKRSYYPFTPTQGCLCSKEIWSSEDGIRIVSDQQKLVNAIKKAGGADGYYVVIEIDDQQKPVSLQEILIYLKQK